MHRVHKVHGVHKVHRVLGVHRVLEGVVDRFRADTFLPLTTVAFEILIALADGDQHGYRIMQEVNARSGESAPLHAGTMYRALARLLEQGLIEELDERPTEDDERRRYYRLSARGVTVARAELDRLEGQVAAARSRRLLKAARA